MEVKKQVNQAAHNYCLADSDCISYGIYVDNGGPLCAYRAIWEWACYGWNLEDDGAGGAYLCDFREIVNREFLGGTTSRQDLTFGLDGWDCGGLMSVRTFDKPLGAGIGSLRRAGEEGS